MPPDGCDANAGTISIEFNAGCLVNGTAMVTATPDGNAVVPAGYSLLYVLTQTNGLIIQAVGATPTFTVNSLDIYRIHTLVYDPATLDLSTVQFGETSAYDIFPLLIAGGGTICASLDVSGAPFKLQECENLCTADAGTLSSVQPDLCLVDGVASLMATPNGNSFVPPGYSLLYVLTQGSGLIIQQASLVASFNVAVAGQYTIHTLVYDPATLDLGIVVFGETTGSDVISLLIQGGGSICGSLDVLGAEFQVVDCAPICMANAGSITSGAADLCLVDGSAALEAIPNADQTVPSGYSVIYVLTQGAGLVLQQVSELPAFTVTTAGQYTIHTLVYDPTSLDLSLVVFGETTASEVNALLIQGGGAICAALDVTGAEFQVADCVPNCTANAGTLTPDQLDAVCLVNGSALISATPNGDAVVPSGYIVAYVLTHGPELFIQNIEPDPNFEWTVTGAYTIHTLVYDPNTLDLSGVQFDVTTGFDINALLIQGGGTICASLDVVGAQFTIIECIPTCTSDAGIGGERLLCFNQGPVDLFSLLNGTPDMGGSWTGPDGLAFEGIFDPVSGVSGIYVYAVQDGPDCPTDTTQLVIDVIECPNTPQPTPIKDGTLESTGSATSVSDLESRTTALSWPNPASDVVYVNLPFSPSQRARVELIDELGRSATVAVTFTGRGLQLDLRSLSIGAYVLRIVDGEHTAVGRFVHAQR